MGNSSVLNSSIARTLPVTLSVKRDYIFKIPEKKPNGVGQDGSDKVGENEVSSHEEIRSGPILR